MSISNKTLRIGVDVDGTTLDSSPAWWNWLWHMCNGEAMGLPEHLEDFSYHSEERVGHSLVNRISYDLSIYFPDPVNHNVDKFDFWRHTGVYDTIKPVKGAVHGVKRLMDDGHHIIFVTHNKGNGGRSKFMNLHRLFGRDNFDCVVTKEKHLVKIDCMIDDRLEFLNPCGKHGIKGYQIETMFEQNDIPHDDVTVCKDWEEIYEEIAKGDKKI